MGSSGIAKFIWWILSIAITLNSSFREDLVEGKVNIAVCYFLALFPISIPRYVRLILS
jgi:hypothetical protein